MKLPVKINSVLVLTLILFIGVLFVISAQYARLQTQRKIEQRTKILVEASQSDADEIIANLLMQQNEGVQLYMSRIKHDQFLDNIAVISNADYFSETKNYKCIAEYSNELTCVTDRNHSYLLYTKLQYGNNDYGYIKKEFRIEGDNIIGSYQLTKIVIIVLPYMLVVFILISWMLKKIVVNPLNNICDNIQPLENGNFDIKISPQKTDELKQLSDSIYSISRHLKKYQDEKMRDSSLIALGQSTAMVAHDVRKPLASMKALLASLPALKNDPAQMEKMVATVDRNIAQTNTMLNDIMEFSRDSTVLEITDRNPHGIVTAALGDALRNHPDAEISISYEFRQHFTALRVDSTRIIRVLTNIIDNAIGAMASNETGKPKGELTIVMSDVKRDEKKFVAIEVSDDGPGIPKDILDKIFDPFFTKGKKGGTGLGLAISQRIINLHGGKMWAENNESGKGARFVIELPAGEGRMCVNESELIRSSKELKMFREEEARRVDYGISANVSEFMRLNKERGRKSYLMIVDDEPLFRETLHGLVNDIPEARDHVKVVEVGSAEEGMKLFEAREFDYVIADIDLGHNRINGYEFAQMVMERHESAYVLIHSNKRKGELDKNIRQIASDKFMGFLPKPMTQSELLQFLACKTFEAPLKTKEEAKTKKNVLIVNDDDALLISFKYMLETPDVAVLSATNVSDAMTKLINHRVDLILSDINLGNDEPSGYDFLKHVREKEPKLPFYFVSGYSEQEEGQKAKAHGASGYLQLPVDAAKMKELLS